MYTQAKSCGCQSLQENEAQRGLLCKVDAAQRSEGCEELGRGGYRRRTRRGVGAGGQRTLAGSSFWRARCEARIPPLRGWASQLPPPQPLTAPPSHTPEPPAKQAFYRLHVSPSQPYCVSTRLPPGCKTFQLPSTTLKVGDVRGFGEGAGGRRAPSLLIAAPLPRPSEECREKAGQDFAEYFYVEYDDNGKPNCISRCEPNFNRSLNCNHGTCQLDRSGPRC